MRPFKFFFGLSIAVMIFFWVAQFVIPALLIAGVLTLIYHGFKRLSYFFQEKRMSYASEAGGYEYLPNARSTFFEDFAERAAQRPVWSEEYRTIRIQ